MNCLQKKKLNQANSSTKLEGSERKDFLKLNRKKRPPPVEPSKIGTRKFSDRV